MEQQIEKTYIELKKIRRNVVWVLLLCMALLIVVVSIFLGSPFPYKQNVLFFSVRQQGWILDKPYIYFICLISLVSAYIWEMIKIESLIKPYRILLYEECDAAALQQAAKMGIEFDLSSYYKNKKRADNVKNDFLIWFEILYVQALNAGGLYSEALEYLKHEWKSKKRKFHKLLLQNVQLNVFYMEKTWDEYENIYQNAVPEIKKDVLIKAQHMCMEKRYADAIEILKDTKYKHRFQEVSAKYRLGVCYYELGEYSKAAEYFIFVIEHGNTMLVKEKAIKLYQRII